jgi:Niemann-Pick C1 protein
MTFEFIFLFPASNDLKRTRPKDKKQLNILDQLGMSFEMGMTNFFTMWGTLCSRYPVPVIMLSVGFALGLSTGIMWLNVTTDPIELWASPTSRSRIERSFFDETFRPFYRTEQIIIHAKDLPNVRPIS